MDINKQPFGQTDDMKLVDLYKLTNLNGMEVRITNYGATLVAVTVADRNGNLEDVILGYDSLADYINGSNYFGCIAGRYANGIAGKAGQVYHHRGGFCLETQHFPDSPNQPDFPSTILDPGTTYEHRTIYRFSATGSPPG